MNKKILVSVYSKTIIDTSKLNIPGENNITFWSRQPFSAEDRKKLKEACKQIHNVFFKSNMKDFNPESLTPIELKTYYDYIDEELAPKLYFDYEDAEFKIKDGRHRLAMCKYLNINPILNVQYLLCFQLYKKSFLNGRKNYTYIGFDKQILLQLRLNNCVIREGEIKGVYPKKRIIIVPYEKEILNQLKDYKVYVSEEEFF